jgi:hypothetical protein
MAEPVDISKTIKQIQTIIRIETKSIRQKGTAGEGKLVALAKLCNSLHGLVQLTMANELEDDEEGYSKPNFREDWGLE